MHGVSRGFIGNYRNILPFKKKYILTRTRIKSDNSRVMVI